MLKFLGLALLPGILALLFRFLWLANAHSDSAVYVSLLAISLNAFVVPLYLSALLIGYARRGVLPLAVPVCYASALGGVYIQYRNWYVSAGISGPPDGETLIVVLFETVVAMAILSVGVGAALYRRFKK